MTDFNDVYNLQPVVRCCGVCKHNLSKSTVDVTCEHPRRNDYGIYKEIPGVEDCGLTCVRGNTKAHFVCDLFEPRKKQP